jgi:hypothetical protein
LNPFCQQVNHRPTNLKAICIQHINRFFKQELLHVVKELATIRVCKWVLAVLVRLQRKAPLP